MATVDDLYALDPADFVAERDRLATALRKEGDREGAAAVKSLRRPTVTAWALNQLARRRGDELRQLVALSSEVARAQADAAGSGDREGFRRLANERRALITRLAAAGVDLLDAREGGSGDARRDDLVASLEAGSADGPASEALLAGQLSKELEPASGFGALLEAASAEAPPGTGGGGPTPRQLRAARDRAERARDAATTASEAAAAADERVVLLERQLAEARAQAESARARAADLAGSAEEAESEVRSVEGKPG